ncbi:MAG: tetratricopeptide repeat protein [Bacteroidota bacterium]
MHAEKSTAELRRFVDENNEKIWNLRSFPKFDAEKVIREVVEVATRIDYKFGVAQGLLNAGMGVFVFMNDGQQSLRYMNEALDIFRELGDKRWIANAHSSIGLIQNTLGNYEPALYNALRGVDFYESADPTIPDRVRSYYIIGTVYSDLKKYQEAEGYFLKGTRGPAIEHSSWGGRVYTGLVNVYTQMGKYELALEYSGKAVERLKLEDNTIGESRIYTEVGIIYKKIKKYPEALDYLTRGLRLREKNSMRQFMITSHMELAALRAEMGDRPSALAHLLEAESLALAVNQLPKLARIFTDLSALYKAEGNYREALNYSEKLIGLNSELHKKEIEERIGNMQNNLLKEKEEEIERLRNVELKQAYELISEKQKEIVDSIKYAKRIQESLLPSEKYIERSLRRLERSGEQAGA